MGHGFLLIGLYEHVVILENCNILIMKFSEKHYPKYISYICTCTYTLTVFRPFFSYQERKLVYSILFHLKGKGGNHLINCEKSRLINHSFRRK